MDKKDIQHTIRACLRDLGSALRRLQRDPADEEGIHQFRVSYKKLRAFLRLLSYPAGFKTLHVPKRLKTVYQTAGPLRDLQLHRKSLHKNIKAPLPRLEARLDEAIEKARSIVSETVQGIELTDLRHKLEKKLPPSISGEHMEGFAGARIRTVCLAVRDKQTVRDATLHGARKHLKDVVYNATLNPDHFRSKAWHRQAKKVTHLARDLGNFQDTCSEIILLRKEAATLPLNEKRQLAAFRRGREAARNESRKVLLEKLQQLVY